MSIQFVNSSLSQVDQLPILDSICPKKADSTQESLMLEVSEEDIKKHTSNSNSDDLFQEVLGGQEGPGLTFQSQIYEERNTLEEALADFSEDHQFFEMNPEAQPTHTTESLSNSEINEELSQSNPEDFQISVESVNPQMSQETFGVESVLKPSNLQQESGKNINTPKFYTRILHAHLWKYKKYYKSLGYGSYFAEFQKKCQKFYAEEVVIKKHVSIAKLNRLLATGSDTETHALNRRVMAEIIQKHIKEEVIDNGQAKKELSYLLMSKVFRLRCRNKVLIQKMRAK